VDRVFFALSLATLVVLRLVYRWLKAKRADSLAARAEQFVQHKNFLEAPIHIAPPSNSILLAIVHCKAPRGWRLV